ncbi:MAG TPA: hypothetical protein VKB64_05045 [Gaiellaceae bacterium]|nr:hypothetical protein [Gaiellaceae bacterium]
MRRPWAWAELLCHRGESAADGVDPRAEELRVKLAESRDQAEPEPAPEGPESRRRAVHESARSTVEQMRKR